MVTQLGCVSETAIDSKAGSGLTIKKPLEEFPKGHHAGSAYSVMMGNRHGKTLQTLICKVCMELFFRFVYDESGTPTIGSSFYF